MCTNITAVTSRLSSGCLGGFITCKVSNNRRRWSYQPGKHGANLHSIWETHSTLVWQTPWERGEKSSTVTDAAEKIHSMTSACTCLHFHLTNICWTYEKKFNILNCSYQMIWAVILFRVRELCYSNKWELRQPKASKSSHIYNLYLTL